MNSFVVKSVFAVALGVAPLIYSAEPSGVFPAPVHLINLSPSFAGYSSDTTLIAKPKPFEAMWRSQSPEVVKRKLVFLKTLIDRWQLERDPALLKQIQESLRELRFGPAATPTTTPKPAAP